MILEVILFGLAALIFTVTLVWKYPYVAGVVCLLLMLFVRIYGHA